MKLSNRRKIHSLTGSAFSLPELLVIIVILGIISAVGVQAFFFLVRRARVQSVALEVAGWIENVRNAAADSIVPGDLDDPVDGGCEISFGADGTYAPGAELATVEPAGCVPENTLRVPVSIAPDDVIIAGTEPVVFTPRGLWIDDDDNPGDGFTLSITLDPGGTERCVRLTPVLGSVEIGRPRAGATACDDAAEWQTL